MDLNKLTPEQLHGCLSQADAEAIVKACAAYEGDQKKIEALVKVCQWLDEIKPDF